MSARTRLARLQELAPGRRDVRTLDATLAWIEHRRDEAEAILAVATATAEGLSRVARAVVSEGGAEAMQLRVAEQYINEFGNLARTGNTFVVPANLADLTSMMALATDIAKGRSTTQ